MWKRDDRYLLVGALASKPPRESLEPFHRLYPPSIDREFRLRMRINHSTIKLNTRIAIPTVTPTMVGTFEVEDEVRLEAGIEVAGCEGRDDDDDRVIVGV